MTQETHAFRSPDAPRGPVNDGRSMFQTACYDPAPMPPHAAPRRSVMRRHTATVVLLTIATCGGLSSFASVAQSELPVLNTPDEGKTSRPIHCRSLPNDEPAGRALEQAAQKRDSTQRRAELLRQSAMTTHTFPEWEALACELLRQKRITDEQYVRVVDQTLPKVSPTIAGPRPELLEPKNGAVFDHYPRRTLVSWKPVAGAAHYLLEVQYRSMRRERSGDGRIYLEDAGWAPHNDGLHSASVLGTGAVFHFIGMQRGRVRIRPVTDDGNTGPPSAWREFRFTK